MFASSGSQRTQAAISVAAAHQGGAAGHSGPARPAIACSGLWKRQRSVCSQTPAHTNGRHQAESIVSGKQAAEALGQALSCWRPGHLKPTLGSLSLHNLICDGRERRDVGRWARPAVLRWHWQSCHCQQQEPRDVLPPSSPSLDSELSCGLAGCHMLLRPEMLCWDGEP